MIKDKTEDYKLQKTNTNSKNNKIEGEKAKKL
jgi:hypothetical protein